MNDTATQLEQLASRAVTLYTRPTVALELVRLAEEPTADAKALKDCVSQDPALVCKLLRVVNSSLFGLNRPVADLNQAIGQLGIKPLKLLVLGFSLPDSLFAEVAARELQWYWTNTLTRAVAARLISEQLWHQAGDEAFIAGLLQDIGILVLLRELGEPYVRFLTGVIDEKCHLASLEQDTLGFDHIQLSAALLARWQLPQRLVDAIETPKRLARLSRMSPPEGDLPQILHLAEMLMQLVGQQRLTVLPDLLEAGRVYRGMTKTKLAELVESLQSQVDQLAEVLKLELSEERNYVQMLVDAHGQMALLSEQIVGEQAAMDEDDIYEQLLAHSGELTDAMQSFLTGKRSSGKSSDARSQSHAAHYGQHQSRGFVGRKTDEPADRVALLQSLGLSAIRCRERRHELSLLVAECSSDAIPTPLLNESATTQARRALASACASIRNEKTTIISLADGRLAVILANCDRRGAISIAHEAIDAFANNDTSAGVDDDELAAMLSVGVATVSAIPKNFDAARIVDSAMRCLAAARAGGISGVKSIEV